MKKLWGIYQQFFWIWDIINKQRRAIRRLQKYARNIVKKIILICKNFGERVGSFEKNRRLDFRERILLESFRNLKETFRRSNLSGVYYIKHYNSAKEKYQKGLRNKK